MPALGLRGKTSRPSGAGLVASAGSQPAEQPADESGDRIGDRGGDEGAGARLERVGHWDDRVRRSVQRIPVAEVRRLDAGGVGDPGRREDQDLRVEPEADTDERRAAPAESADALREGAEVEAAHEGEDDDG